MADKKTLRITVASINFHPDHAGIAIYATDLPVYFAERGHRVAMVSGFPYYPIWRKQPGDRRRIFGRDHYHGVEVFRGYLYVPEKVTTLRRIIHEVTFSTFAGLNFLRAGRPDAIVVFTPPVLLGVVALILARVWRRPLVINVQDLPVEAATSLGMVRAGWLTRLLLKIEQAVYRRADLVATISHGMKDTLLGKGVPAGKIGIFPNWIDVTAARWRVEPGRFLPGQPQALGRFTLAYAGNLGIKQGVDTLLELAAQVREEKAHFFVIGDGADKANLVRIAAELKLTNVTFLPFLPPEKYKEMLEDVDAVFVAQRSGTGNIFFPSKLLGVMAAGKPLLVSAEPESELARVISTERIGLVSRFGDVAALVRNFKQMRTDAELRREFTSNGHRHVLEYDRERILSRMEQRVEELARVAAS